MSKRAFRIAYDGTGYRGFQRQPDVSTVEDAIFDALRSLDVYDPAIDDDGPERPTGYAAAGRTDAGVSALAQTIALAVPDWLTPRAFNASLPADVRAWAATDVSDSFHATHDAARRTYTYHLYAPPVDGTGASPVDRTEVPSDDHTNAPPKMDDRSADPRSEARHAIDDERFRAACDALSGSHDFHNFTPDDRNTQRELTVEAKRDGDFLVLTVSAGGFARELVRRLVSLARAVGTGEASLDSIDRALAPDPLPGHEGIAPAPPEPLVLTDVSYPDCEFAIDDRAAESARAVFDQRRIDRRTGARVAGQICDGIE